MDYNIKIKGVSGDNLTRAVNAAKRYSLSYPDAVGVPKGIVYAQEWETSPYFLHVYRTKKGTLVVEHIEGV